jgi:hypothetical protein
MTSTQNALLGLAAVALGVWLGVSVGLATRARPH